MARTAAGEVDRVARAGAGATATHGTPPAAAAGSASTAAAGGAPRHRLRDLDRGRRLGAAALAAALLLAPLVALAVYLPGAPAGDPALMALAVAFSSEIGRDRED